MAGMDERFKKRAAKDAKLVWMPPGEMADAVASRYTLTRRDVCQLLKFSDSTFKRYVHVNVEHVYDNTQRPAMTYYDREQLLDFIAEHVKLEQRVKYVNIENYVEDWDAYNAALDAIDAELRNDLRNFAENPVGANGELLGEDTGEYKEWKAIAGRLNRRGRYVRFSATRDEVDELPELMREYIRKYRVEKRVREAQFANVSEEARGLMNVRVDEHKRTSLEFVDITDAADELIQALKKDIPVWENVASVRMEGESDEEVYRRLFKGSGHQANIRVTLTMPDKDGLPGKRVYYVADPLVATAAERGSRGSRFNVVATGMDAFVKSGLAL